MVNARKASNDTCLGLVEIASIPAGVQAADAIMKEAPVQTLICRPMTPARFLVVFEGDVESVSRSLGRAREIAGSFLVGSLFLPQPHTDVLAAIHGVREIGEIDAVGVLECTQVAATITAADAAAKAATVHLLEVRLAMGLHGHGFFTLCGEVSDVEAALEAAAASARSDSAWHDQTLIANPDEELKRHLTHPQPPFSPLP